MSAPINLQQFKRFGSIFTFIAHKTNLSGRHESCVHRSIASQNRSLWSSVTNQSPPVAPTGPILTGVLQSKLTGNVPIRTVMSLPRKGHGRRGFYYPSLVRRINKHGLWKRMMEPSGREMIMRRMLKGRYKMSPIHYWGKPWSPRPPK